MNSFPIIAKIFYIFHLQKRITVNPILQYPFPWQSILPYRVWTPKMLSSYKEVHGLCRTINPLLQVGELFRCHLWSIVHLSSSNCRRGALFFYNVSVRLWNFKYGGSSKVRFLAKNQHTPKEKVFKNPYGECQFIKNWE